MTFLEKVNNFAKKSITNALDLHSLQLQRALGGALLLLWIKFPTCKPEEAGKGIEKCQLGQRKHSIAAK